MEEGCYGDHGVGACRVQVRVPVEQQEVAQHVTREPVLPAVAVEEACLVV